MNDTLPVVLRFGPDGGGATVYVNTAALPEWGPIAGEERVLKICSDGMRQVLHAANGPQLPAASGLRRPNRTVSGYVDTTRAA